MPNEQHDLLHEIDEPLHEPASEKQDNWNVPKFIFARLIETSLCGIIIYFAYLHLLGPYAFLLLLGVPATIAARKRGRLPRELTTPFLLLSMHLCWYLVVLLLAFLGKHDTSFELTITVFAIDVALLTVFLTWLAMHPTPIALNTLAYYELFCLLSNRSLWTHHGMNELSAATILSRLPSAVAFFATGVGYLAWHVRMKSQGRSTVANHGHAPELDEISISSQSASTRERYPETPIIQPKKLVGAIALIAASFSLILSSYYCYHSLEWGGHGAKPGLLLRLESITWGVLVMGAALTALVLPLGMQLHLNKPKPERSGGIPYYLPGILITFIAIGLTAAGYYYPNGHRLKEIQLEAKLLAEAEAPRNGPISASTPRTEVDPIYQPDGTLLLTTDYTRKAAETWLKEFAISEDSDMTNAPVPQQESGSLTIVSNKIEDEGYSIIRLALPDGHGKEIRNIYVSPSGKWLYIVAKKLDSDFTGLKFQENEFVVYQIDSTTFEIVRSLSLSNPMCLSVEGLFIERRSDPGLRNTNPNTNTMVLLDYDTLEQIGRPIVVQAAASYVSHPESSHAFSVKEGKVAVYDLKAGRMAHLFDWGTAFSLCFENRFQLRRPFNWCRHIGEGEGLLLHDENRSDFSGTAVVRIEGENLYWIGTIPRTHSFYDRIRWSTTQGAPLIVEHATLDTHIAEGRVSLTIAPQLVTSQGRSNWEFNRNGGSRFFTMDSLMNPVQEFEGIELPSSNPIVHLDQHNNILHEKFHSTDTSHRTWGYGIKDHAGCELAAITFSTRHPFDLRYLYWSSQEKNRIIHWSGSWYRCFEIINLPDIESLRE